MKTSAGFFAVAILAASGQLALAAPYDASSKYATHHVRELKNGRRAVTYQAASHYETFGEGLEHRDLVARAKGDWKGLGVSYLESRLGNAKLTVTSSFAGEKSDHVYVQQSVNGIPVANAVANVALNKGGKVAAFGHSFITPGKVASAKPTLTSEQAIAKAEELLGGKYNDFATKLEYVHTESGDFVLAHTVQVWEHDNGHLLEGFIDAHSGEVVAINDFTNSLTYRVLPIQKQAPTEGFENLSNPQDSTASPFGWHQVPGSSATNTTAGNNVVAYKSSTSGTSTANSGSDFIYTWNSTAQPTVAPNIDVARVNAFYISNKIHDITYRYGFTESAFNFQQDNNGKGGKGNDRVTLSVQDSAGTNNADFSTPADGSSGHMRMFLWTYTTSPRRDGAIENDIVAHEQTHGLSNRLTGGGTGRCLQTKEAGGMGEGWSDAFAEWTEQTSATLRDFTLGSFVVNKTAGIRTHPYSTSKTTNPLTYGSIKTLNEVHDIGEVWANILHNVHQALLSAHGYSADAQTNPAGTGGNVVFLHLFIDGLALQPCNPTLPTARDAWIQADANRYAGANKCILWNAFASRGLGVGASGYTNSATVPSGC